MPRSELSQGDLLIAFGHDHVSGYFLSVYDLRLRYNEDNSDELNTLGEQTSPDGSGCYLNVHTGSGGFGSRVSIATMRDLWSRYRVSPEGLQALSEGLPNI
jgi:hypothetical protein